MAKKNNKNAPKEHPLVAIDMGSSGFKAMAAESLPDGTLRILDIATSKHFSCMERGVVVNSSSAGYMITEALTALGKRMNYDDVLPSAYTAIGAVGMGVTKVQSVRRPGVLRPIEPSLEQMRAECYEKIRRAGLENDKEIEAISVIPAVYELDDSPYSPQNVKNMSAKSIRGRYTAIYAPTNVKEKVNSSFLHSGKALDASFSRAEALVESLVSEIDEQNGVAIVDFGAETTSITVYKNERYLAHKVVPLGGKDITLDIQKQGVSMSHAEALKQKYGFASEKYVEKNNTLCVPSEIGEQKYVRISLSLLAQIISSRLNEILGPIMRLINEVGDRISIVYITGGASRLRSLPEYMSTLTSVPVRYGSHADWLADDTPDEWFAPDYSALVGTILLGIKNREKKLPPEQESKFGKMKDNFISLFFDQE